MAKKKVGLYIGTGSVGVALWEAKQLLFSTSIDLSSVGTKDAESLDENLHWQALIRKSLRQANVEEKQVYLSLADRDFIVRSLEMPLMKKAEIESALVYEVEKYIPFKPEELVWDYQHEKIPKEKKIRVSFVGIRKSTLARTKRILHNVEIQPLAIEPACLSLARSLKANKLIGKAASFALLDFTSQEAYLTFFQNELPVFNRYLSVKEKEGNLDIDSFTEAVNFSFQYFRREFKGCELDKIFILAFGPELDTIAEHLKESLGLEIEKVTPYDLTSQKQSSVEGVKALGCAEREDYPYKFKPELKEFEEVKPPEAIPASQVPWKWSLLGGVAALALAIYTGSYLFFNNALSSARQDFTRREESLPLPEELAYLGWENIGIAIESRQSQLRELEQFIKGNLELSKFLALFGQRNILPPEMWLDSFTLRRFEQAYQVRIEGYVYKGDDYQEREAINDFVEEMRNQEIVTSLFSSVESPSISRRVIRDFTVTEFSVELR